jgi:hypothetical protein
VLKIKSSLTVIKLKNILRLTYLATSDRRPHLLSHSSKFLRRSFFEQVHSRTEDDLTALLMAVVDASTPTFIDKRPVNW